MVSSFGISARQALLQVFIATLMFTGSNLHAWDFQGHYNRRVDAITTEVETLDPAATDTIVLLGDSLTAGNKVKELCGRKVVNMGISGDQIQTTSAGVMRRVPLVKAARPADIFLLIGINDFGSSKPLETTKEQYSALVAELKSQVPGARLHIQALLPVSGRFAHHLPNVVKMNEFLRGLAHKNTAEFVDLYALMRNEKGEFKPEYTTEGLHLTPAAYKAWNENLEALLGCSK